MEDTLTRTTDGRRARRRNRQILTYDRHGDVADHLDDDCGATVLEHCPVFSRLLAKSPVRP